MQLLNTGDGGVADTLGITVLGEGSVDLARAQDNTLDLLRGLDGGTVSGIGDDPLEVRVTSEGIQIGAGNRVTQEGLGEEDNQSCKRENIRQYNLDQWDQSTIMVELTLAELAVHLATENVEDVRGLSHADNLHVTPWHSSATGTATMHGMACGIG